jgi:hypothetical protein
MVRIKSPDAALLDWTDESIEYADWTGTKHLSTVEIFSLDPISQQLSRSAKRTDERQSSRADRSKTISGMH